MNVAARARRTGLGAGLSLLGLLGGCSTTTTAPEPDPRRAALWAAATECAEGKQASLRVDRVDEDARMMKALEAREGSTGGTGGAGGGCACN